MLQVVCIKQVPDTETRVKVAADGRTLDPAGVTMVLNPYDEFAVEAALRVKEMLLKEQLAAGEVVVVSLGAAGVQSTLRNALAMGADRAIHLKTDVAAPDALAVAKALEGRLGSSLKPITMHWSGCPASCGNHLVADVGLLGKKAKIDGKVVEAVDIYVGGRSGPDPKLALKIMEDVPCDKLPAVLEGLLPYHTREKMHRVRGGGARKVTAGKEANISPAA